MTRSGFSFWNTAVTAEWLVISRSARVSPWTSHCGAHRGAVFRRYCPINPAAPVTTTPGHPRGHNECSAADDGVERDVRIAVAFGAFFMWDQHTADPQVAAFHELMIVDA